MALRTGPREHPLGCYWTYTVLPQGSLQLYVLASGIHKLPHTSSNRPHMHSYPHIHLACCTATLSRN